MPRRDVATSVRSPARAPAVRAVAEALVVEGDEVIGAADHFAASLRGVAEEVVGEDPAPRRQSLVSRYRQYRAFNCLIASISSRVSASYIA